MTKIALFLSGRGSNFISIYKSLLRGDVQNATISCVISDRADSIGLKYAEEQGLNALFVDPKLYVGRQTYDKQILKILTDLEVDLICLAGYMRIISDVLVTPYYGRMINIHPSLLPSFPGLDAQKQAVSYGVKVSGCTVHFVDNGMDTGPIIMQVAVDVCQDDTEETLSARILEQEHKLYPHVVSLYCAGRVKLVDNKVRII